VDVRVNIADDPSTSVKNLVNFGPLTPVICGALAPGELRIFSYANLVTLYITCSITCVHGPVM